MRASSKGDTRGPSAPRAGQAGIRPQVSRRPSSTSIRRGGARLGGQKLPRCSLGRSRASPRLPEEISRPIGFSSALPTWAVPAVRWKKKKEHQGCPRTPRAALVAGRRESSRVGKGCFAWSALRLLERFLSWAAGGRCAPTGASVMPVAGLSMAARQHSTDDFGQAQREGHAARAKNRQFARATLCLAHVLIPSIYDHVNVGGLQFGRRSTCIEIEASRQLVGEWYLAGFDAQLQCLRSPMAERQRIAAPRLSMVCIGN